MITVVMEFTTVGHVISSHTIETVQLYRYKGPGGVVALLVEIACIIFIIVMAILEIRKMVKEGAKYIRSIYNTTQLVIILLFTAALVVYIFRSLWTIWTLEEMMNNRSE